MTPVVRYCKVKVLLWFLGALLVIMLPQTAFSATAIAWKEEVTVTGPMLTLGDLAYLSGDDPVRVALLQTVGMGEVPDPGKTRYLTGEVLLARLSVAGISPRAEGWPLPCSILVTTLSQTISRDIIDQKVAEALTGQIAYPGDDTTIQLRGRLHDVQIPVGPYEIAVTFPRGVRVTGPTQAVADILVDDRPVERIYLTYDVKIMVNAYIVKNTVGRHQFLSEADVAVEKRMLSGLPVRAVKDAVMLKSYWTRRAISPGTVLTEDMLDIPPAAKRNSQVTIIVDYGGIFITTYGLALQDGRPGDVIRVRNLESQRIIMAKVQQDGTVVPLG